MPILFKNQYVTISRITGSNIVCIKRSAVESSGTAHIEETDRVMRGLFPIHDRAELVLLNDMRDAPMLRDPEQERLMMPFVERMVEGFARRAILLRTPTGRLQARRLSTETQLPPGFFNDEEEALRFLSRPRAKSP